jgi:hypothetical protein
MHQRQAGTYGRRFYFGKKLDDVLEGIELVPRERSVGLIPSEFDDLQGGEIDMKEDLGNREALAAE